MAFNKSSNNPYNFNNLNLFILKKDINKYGLIGSTKIYKEMILIFAMNKRVVFSKENQKRFIKDLKEKSNLKWIGLAKKLEINKSTLSKSYMFKLSSIPYSVFKKISKFFNEKENNLIKKYEGKVIDEIKIIGRKCFGEQRKIFDKICITFNNTDLNLNISNINYSLSDIKKDIKIPNKITPELAEEIGMHYGDGFLSAKRYDYRLKGNPLDEKEYYKNYIKLLFKRLYNANLNLKESYKSFGFELYSQAIWEFKTKVIGIKPGNKKDLCIPKTLKINNQKVLCAFIRGLFDTDGSLCFKSRYGYKKYYPEISISLVSKNIIREVGDILKMLGFNPNIYFNNRYGIITINGINALKKYEELIGWSSQKNLNKLNSWKNRYPQLNNMAVVVQWLEREPVALETGVRFSPTAFKYQNKKE